MRGLFWVLAVLILLLQYPLWLGKGSWLRVWELEREVDAQKTANLALEARNVQLGAEARICTADMMPWKAAPGSNWGWCTVTKYSSMSSSRKPPRRLAARLSSHPARRANTHE